MGKWESVMNYVVAAIVVLLAVVGICKVWTVVRWISGDRVDREMARILRGHFDCLASNKVSIRCMLYYMRERLVYRFTNDDAMNPQMRLNFAHFNRALEHAGLDSMLHAETIAKT